MTKFEEATKKHTELYREFYHISAEINAFLDNDPELKRLRAVKDQAIMIYDKAYFELQLSLWTKHKQAEKWIAMKKAQSVMMSELGK